jgi:hypothetical protein
MSVIKLGMAINSCNPSSLGGGGRKITNLRLAWAKLGRLSKKQDANKRTKGMARVVEFWP